MRPTNREGDTPSESGAKPRGGCLWISVQFLADSFSCWNKCIICSQYSQNNATQTLQFLLTTTIGSTSDQLLRRAFSPLFFTGIWFAAAAQQTPFSLISLSLRRRRLRPQTTELNNPPTSLMSPSGPPCLPLHTPLSSFLFLLSTRNGGRLR